MFLVQINSKFFPNRYKRFTNFIASDGIVCVDNLINPIEVMLYLDPRYYAKARDCNVNFKPIKERPTEECVIDIFEWSIGAFYSMQFEKMILAKYSDVLDDIEETGLMYSQREMNVLQKYVNEKKIRYFAPFKSLYKDFAKNEPLIFEPDDKQSDELYFDPSLVPLAFLDQLDMKNAVHDILKITDAIIENIEEYKKFMKNDAIAWVQFWQDIVQNYSQYTEQDAVQVLSQKQREIHGEMWQEAFETILGNNDHASHIHGQPCEKELEAGLVLVDAGSQVPQTVKSCEGRINNIINDDINQNFQENTNVQSIHNMQFARDANFAAHVKEFGSSFCSAQGNNDEYFISDITRVFWLNSSHSDILPSDEIKNNYTSVVKAFIAAAMCEFDEIVELDKVARNFVQFDHALGHGVGKHDVHAFPAILAKTKDKLVPGMVVAIEPGLYGDNFGIRIENQFLVCKKDNGKLFLEILTYIPLEYDLIVYEDLTENEQQWLSKFHKICYEELVGNIDSDFLHKKVDRFIIK